MKIRSKIDPRVSQHSILLCEIRGNTLVVTPSRTLLGIDRKIFHAELARTRELLRLPSIQNLVLDLSQERYFGSEMIGAFFALEKEVPETGQTFIAEPSSDLRVILEEMLVEQVMPIVENAEAKIREISGETSLDRMKRRPKTIFGSAAVLVTALVAVLAVTTNLFAPILGTEESRLLDRLAKSFDRTLDIQQDKFGPQLWGNYSKEQNELFGDKVSELGLKADRSGLEESLYQATLDVWKMSLSTTLPTEEELKKAHGSLVTSAEQISTLQGVDIKIPDLEASDTATLLNQTTAAGDFRRSRLSLRVSEK
ncbi:hypothetical protein [Thalassoglobus polymorphus]|uniref:STAS domain-containing protein n=1 Tax=Thalassoglobus polymorphus TaxID=2527994 RepID=A0A517QUJ3_9PLAN|nr:hypothetical protein [Thalassoglobus polymorphus]QDT35284.1 hypothetical protein Mal48_45600 [Thalassoglobus polymorphus]